MVPLFALKGFSSMRKVALAMIVTGCLILGFVAASGESPAPTRSVLSALEVGEKVTIARNDNGNGTWQIFAIEKGRLLEKGRSLIPPQFAAELHDCKVTELGPDYIAVQDDTAVESRIPVCSIQAVFVFKGAK
jgi:hypothetical protein